MPTKPLVVAEPEVTVAPARGWVVVLHNDDHHTFVYVILVLCRTIHVSAEEAERLAIEVHNAGSAVVAGPMSKYEAAEIATALGSYGPDPWSRAPQKNVGLKATIREA